MVDDFLVMTHEELLAYMQIRAIKNLHIMETTYNAWATGLKPTQSTVCRHCKWTWPCPSITAVEYEGYVEGAIYL